MLRWSIHCGEAYKAVMAGGYEWEFMPPPELLPGLSEWYDDFFELSTDRQVGMAAGPIPRASITEHTKDWPWEDADCFHACMRAMDALYLQGDKSEPPEGLRLNG